MNSAPTVEMVLVAFGADLVILVGALAWWRFRDHG